MIFRISKLGKQNTVAGAQDIWSKITMTRNDSNKNDLRFDLHVLGGSRNQGFRNQDSN